MSLLLASGAVAAQAQTSGTLTPTATTYNYSTAPYVLTGPGTYSNGGTLTVNSFLGSTPGTVASSTTITMDVSPTLSQIYVNNPRGSGLGTGAVSIGASSALAGSFTLADATSVAGRLSPGNTPAALTVASAGNGAIGTAAFNTTLALASTSTLYLEAASNVSSDQIKVGGVFNLAGTVTIATLGTYAFQPGDVVGFADWGSITVGTVAFNTAGAAVAPGYQLDTSFFTTDGTIRVSAVPEPGTLAAVTLGLGALGGLQFARRRLQS